MAVIAEDSIISVTTEAAEMAEVSKGSIISVISVTTEVAKNAVVAKHLVISVTPKAAKHSV